MTNKIGLALGAFAVAALAVVVPGWAQTGADVVRAGAAQVLQNTGVYNRPATARTPSGASEWARPWT